MSLDPFTAIAYIVGHFLFVAYEAVVPGVTALPVGLLKAFFLATQPFAELVLKVRAQRVVACSGVC